MIVGIIPARKGSKGIPGKNMIDLGGRPLLDYTLAMAESCRQLDRIILTTNMPDAIDWATQHYRRIETPFVRPEHLAGSSASPVEVVLHAIDYLEERETLPVKVIVLLQPTCPFRRLSEVEEAISLFQANNLDSLIGVSRVWHHPSDYIYRNPENMAEFKYVFRESNWKQRQDFPEVLFMTGALYICRAEYLRSTHGFYDQQSHLFKMAEETMIDIDSPFDLTLARGLLATSAVIPAKGNDSPW